MLTKAELESIEREVLKCGKLAMAHYYDMVASGESPRFALMCASRQAPMTRLTDRTFNAERRHLMETMNPGQRDSYLAMAKRAGISTSGQYYVGALGRPTDPAAWVSTVDEAKNVCKNKNLTSRGLVEHQGHEVEYKKVKMADDIRDRYVTARLARDRPLAAKCAVDPSTLRRVQAEAVDRHAPASK